MKNLNEALTLTFETLPVNFEHLFLNNLINELVFKLNLNQNPAFLIQYNLNLEFVSMWSVFEPM